MKTYNILKIRAFSFALLMVFGIYVSGVKDWTKGLDSEFIVYAAQSGGSPGPAIGTGTTYFAQIADGGGYSTTFTILNTNTSAVVGRLRLFNEDGSPKVLSINGVTDSQFSMTVPANGSVRLTTPNSGSTILTGWAAFDSNPRLQGVATFDYRSSGTLLATAGVLGTAGSSRVIVPIDLNGVAGSTGIAIANIQSDSSIGVRLRLYKESGEEVANILDSRLNPLGAQKHVADFVENFFKNLSGTTFKGTLAVEVIGSGICAVTGLNIKEGLLSAVPAIDASSPSTTTAPAPDFTLSLTPSSLSVARNTAGTFTLTLTASNGFSGTVILLASGVPPGTNGFSPSAIPTLNTANSPLIIKYTVTPNDNAQLASYPLFFTADSGSIHKQANASLAVTGPTLPTSLCSGGTPPPNSSGTKPFNQTQTEKLCGGKWQFTFALTFPPSEASYTYAFSTVSENTSKPGEYIASGSKVLLSTASLTLGGYDPAKRRFWIGLSSDKAEYIFTFIGDNTLMGCYLGFYATDCNGLGAISVTGTRVR